MEENSMENFDVWLHDCICIFWFVQKVEWNAVAWLENVENVSPIREKQVLYDFGVVKTIIYVYIQVGKDNYVKFESRENRENWFKICLDVSRIICAMSTTFQQQQKKKLPEVKENPFGCG